VKCFSKNNSTEYKKKYMSEVAFGVSPA